MHILLTGATGFLGKFLLRDLLLLNHDVYCLIRAKDGLTANERWKMLLNDSLYYMVAKDKAIMKEGSLDTLNQLKWEEPPDLIIHCAANLNHQDMYQNLYRDNVIGVKNLCEMAIQSMTTPRIIFISTCYIHPKESSAEPSLLPSGIPRTSFRNDYTYTKYLAEEFLSSQPIQLSIIRPSLISAPSNWLDAHPSYNAKSHLAIISRIIRKKITHIAIPSTMTINVVPVNIVSQCICEEIEDGASESEIHIQQVCASVKSTWNINVNTLLTTLKDLLPTNNTLTILNIDISLIEDYLRSLWGYSVYLPWEKNALERNIKLHWCIEDYLDSPNFISTIPESHFPLVPDKQVCEQMCLYVARGIHQYKLDKGFLKPKADYYYTSIINDHEISATIIFSDPLKFASKEEAIERAYNCISSYRPFFSLTDQKALRYSITQAPEISWEKILLNSKSCNIEILGTFDNVTGANFKLHHGIGDGVSFLGLIPRFISINQGYPQQSLIAPTARQSSLSFEQEIRCLVYYICVLVSMWFGDSPSLVKSTKTIEKSTHTFQKNPGKTFTCSMIENSFPSFRSALNKDTIIYSIPALIAHPRDKLLEMPRNAFIPIILPWSASAGEIQELCLRSKAVKFVAWCIVQFLAITEFSSVIHKSLDKIDVICSSLLASDRPLPNIESLHFVSPMSSQVPFTMGLLTVGKETHITVTSTIESCPASRIMNELTGSK
jgi:thioester reductase-like protein